MGNSVFFGEQYTERTLIESILASHYIVDYGFIKSVNPDKTIDVTHAKQLKTLDGQSLKATVTKNVEVLTLCGGGFSFTFDYKKGDKVLLLGLKDYVPKTEDVTSATETTAYLHYSRETIKAIPLCVFNGEAKATVVVKDGKIELNGNSKQFVTWAELNQALQKLIIALNSHTHSNGNEGSPTGAPIVPMTLDISASKTTTIVTGG
jgi:hypothetical protein